IEQRLVAVPHCRMIKAAFDVSTGDDAPDSLRLGEHCQLKREIHDPVTCTVFDVTPKRPIFFALDCTHERPITGLELGRHTVLGETLAPATQRILVEVADETGLRLANMLAYFPPIFL